MRVMMIEGAVVSGKKTHYWYWWLGWGDDNWCMY